MKGVILAVDNGNSLYPLTKATSKFLLPVGREPMLYHPLRQLVGAGITEILIVSKAEHLGNIVTSLGHGEAFGCTLTYTAPTTTTSMAHVLASAESFVGPDTFCLMLGDHIFFHDIGPHVRAFAAQPLGARVLKPPATESQPHASALAQPVQPDIRHNTRAVRRPKTSLGLALYDAHVFAIMQVLRPSQHDVWDLTATNNVYRLRGQLECDTYAGRWIAANTFESLYAAHRLMMETPPSCGMEQSQSVVHPAPHQLSHSERFPYSPEVVRALLSETETVPPETPAAHPERAWDTVSTQAVPSGKSG